MSNTVMVDDIEVSLESIKYIEDIYSDRELDKMDDDSLNKAIESSEKNLMEDI